MPRPRSIPATTSGRPHSPSSSTPTVAIVAHQAVPSSQKGSWTSFLKSYVHLHPFLTNPDLIFASFIPPIPCHFLAAPQNRVVLRRPLILDRAAVYPLTHLAHGVPWCAVTCLPWTDNAGILTLRACPPTRTAYWCERPGLFAAIADAKTEQARSIAVLKWFIVSVAPYSPENIYSMAISEHA